MQIELNDRDAIEAEKLWHTMIAEKLFLMQVGSIEQTKKREVIFMPQATVMLKITALISVCG